MAFNLTSRSATEVKNVGIVHSPRWFYGTVALSSGTIDVKIPGVVNILVAFAESQTSNAARVSATATNTLTLSGTSADVVMWAALAQ